MCDSHRLHVSLHRGYDKLSEVWMIVGFGVNCPGDLQTHFVSLNHFLSFVSLGFFAETGFLTFLSLDLTAELIKLSYYRKSKSDKRSCFIKFIYSTSDVYHSCIIGLRCSGLCFVVGIPQGSRVGNKASAENLPLLRQLEPVGAS